MTPYVSLQVRRPLPDRLALGRASHLQGRAAFVSVHCTALSRQALAAMAAKKNIDWGAQPLGKVADTAIAAALGCSSPAVGLARRRRGIQAVHRQRPTCDPESFAASLGKRRDREIAAEHGLSEGQVSRARRQRGISSTRVDWSRQPLGSVPDIVLARRHGVDNKVVAEARWRRGIEKWQEDRECPCGEPFTAVHRRQRYCSSRCQRYHWQLVNQHGMDPSIADVRVALRAYRKTMEGRVAHVANKPRTTRHDS